MVKRQKGRKLLWFDCLLTRTHRDSSASFDIVALNPFRFSSEYYDSELDLVYYNYRHYSPSFGRFLSRDPIEEQGGLNLYPFVKNAPIFKLDELGRSMIAPGAEVWNPLPPQDKYTTPAIRRVYVTDIIRTQTLNAVGMENL